MISGDHPYCKKMRVTGTGGCSSLKAINRIYLLWELSSWEILFITEHWWNSQNKYVCMDGWERFFRGMMGKSTDTSGREIRSYFLQKDTPCITTIFVSVYFHINFKKFWALRWVAWKVNTGQTKTYFSACNPAGTVACIYISGKVLPSLHKWPQQLKEKPSGGTAK